MSKCRFLTPCGICEIKSMSGIPYKCDLMRIGKLEEEEKMPIPKFVEDKTYTDKDSYETIISEDDSNMTDKIKQAVADEFKYRARYGREKYSMEAVINIVNQVIDEVAFEKNEVMPQEQLSDVEWIAREDMDYLDENKVVHKHFECNKCGFIHDFIDGHTSQYNFCPECGADMRKGDAK